MKSIYLVTIMGLGQNPKGPCLGWRPFAEGIKSTAFPDLKLVFRSHTNTDEPTYLLDADHILIQGHSFGGDEAINMVDWLKRKSKSVDALLLADAKPRGLRWLNPWYKYTKPTNVSNAQAFISGFGKGFNNSAPTKRLYIGHSDFPTNLDVLLWMTDQVSRAYAYAKSEYRVGDVLMNVENMRGTFSETN